MCLIPHPAEMISIILLEHHPSEMWPSSKKFNKELSSFVLEGLNSQL